MSATQFVLENIIIVMGGTGAVVTGLSTYLGKRWADSALLKEKSKFETDLKILENKHSMSIKLLEKDLALELIKKDQFHQISKSTYENLFNKKIAVYSNLLKLKTDYDRFQNESGTFEYIDPTNQILSHFSLFKKEVEDNRLYISNELSDNYDNWYEQAAPFFQRIESAEMDLHANSRFSSNSEVHPQDVWDVQEPIFEEFVTNTFDKMTTVINQITLDVKEIKNSMSLVNT